MKKNILVSCFFIFGIAWSALAVTSIRVKIPSSTAVNIPSSITSLGILDRTMRIQDSTKANTKNEDMKGIIRSLDGLHEVIIRSNRYMVFLTPDRYDAFGLQSEFPAPMSLALVQDFCDSYQVDAVVVLETFDKSFKLTHSTREEDVKGTNGSVSKQVVHYMEGEASVELGFRVYNRADGAVLDEHKTQFSKKWYGRGATKEIAQKYVVTEEYAIPIICFQAGEEYSERILPRMIEEDRFYNKKGKDARIAEGCNLALENKWKDAIDLWINVFESDDNTSKGYAAYNIALGFEVLGNLDDALLYAKKSLVDYGDKDAKAYVALLEKRIAERNEIQKK